MHLKSLDIKGFKSFAESVVLDFEPGVSVIVGPNGSGKSNVVDAIGWVLGAQAPSAVRSSKMDDVIFAGTQSRPALGRAEVALTIDNSSGVLPIEFTEVTIARTLFRSGDSEYALNGVPCRLLDIQDLLSDAGVGRQQHVIVSQGQIDAILNARSEDRRLVIEEAAGVLKYRKRKEKAARRLASTEGNLTRLQDLLREVRRQLRPLERQADAARRHGQVVSELTGLRMFLAGREIESLRRRLEVGRQDRAELSGAERELKARLARLDEQVRSAETELSSMGGDDLGDLLATFESLNEKARGQLAVLAERVRGLEHERGAFVGQDVVATMEADAVKVREELAVLDEERASIEPELMSFEAALEEFASERASFDAELAEQGAQQQLPLGEGVAATSGAPVGPGPEGPVPRQELAARLSGLRKERVEAEERLHASDERRQAAEAEAQAWQARLEALELALHEARSGSGADRLREIEGVVGRLADLLTVDEGWDAAIEAALGEAFSAVVVRDEASAGRALRALEEGRVSGAVLALGLARTRRSVPPFGVPVRPHVRADDTGLERLLDDLLAGAVAVESWESAIEAALRHPETIVVAPDGSRFGPAGWRLGAGSTQATASALDEARQRADAAAEARRRAAVDAAAARSEAEIARRRELETSRQLGRAFDDARAALDARSRELEARRSALEVRRAGSEEKGLLLRSRLEELDRKLGDHAEQRAVAGERLEGLGRRARALEALRRFVEDRHSEITGELVALRLSRRRQSEVTKEIVQRLEGLRSERTDAERELGEIRERLQRIEIEEAEYRLRLETATDSLRRDLQVEPEQAVAAECPQLAEGVTAVARVRELERELRIMGPINPLALAEFEALQERHDFLVEQLDDVKKTRRDLYKIIREIDREVVAVFAAAFADVAENFRYLFETLFPGGQGRLRLTDPDNLLETGIEVEARPSGKNVKKLSLLSGGERSLTALAFLFAVFRSRPSPFYVMDEVEAALDDINLHRFLELVQEFRRDAQLIIVSHQKRTMEAADCLYGVSMQSGGSSKVVSEKVAEVQFA